MDRKDLGRFYADNVGLIHVVARKGYGRLQGIGASVDYDDLFQDLSETFIKSFDGFDDDAGKFSTYFITAARNKVNQIAEGYELDRMGVKTTRYKSSEIDTDTGKSKWKTRKEKIHAGAISVEEMAAHRNEDDDGASVIESIDSGMASPEQIVEAQQELDYMLGRLSPLAATMVELTINPPAFIEHELVANEAHAEFARSNGIPRRNTASISVGFIADVLEKTTDLPTQTIRAAKREILEIAKDL